MLNIKIRQKSYLSKCGWMPRSHFRHVFEDNGYSLAWGRSVIHSTPTNINDGAWEWREEFGDYYRYVFNQKTDSYYLVWGRGTLPASPTLPTSYLPGPSSTESFSSPPKSPVSSNPSNEVFPIFGGHPLRDEYGPFLSETRNTHFNHRTKDAWDVLEQTPSNKKRRSQHDSDLAMGERQDLSPYPAYPPEISGGRGFNLKGQGSKRSYDNASFQGYGKGFADDSIVESTEDDRLGGISNKRRFTGFETASHSVDMKGSFKVTPPTFDFDLNEAVSKNPLEYPDPNSSGFVQTGAFQKKRTQGPGLVQRLTSGSHQPPYSPLYMPYTISQDMTVKAESLQKAKLSAIEDRHMCFKAKGTPLEVLANKSYNYGYKSTPFDNSVQGGLPGQEITDSSANMQVSMEGAL